jgi:hypothetical protein
MKTNNCRRPATWSLLSAAAVACALVQSAVAEPIGVGTRFYTFGHVGTNTNEPFVVESSSAHRTRSYAHAVSVASGAMGRLNTGTTFTAPGVVGRSDWYRSYAYFADKVTISSPGREGQTGRLNITYKLAGSVRASGSTNNTAYVYYGGGFESPGDGVIPRPTFSWDYNGVDGAGNYNGGDFWMHIYHEVYSWHNPPGSTAADISLADWSGFQNIRSDVPRLLARPLRPNEFIVTSDSGTDWTQPSSPRLLWRQQHFGTLVGTGAAADEADPDDDGMSNLLEYAFGSNPLAPTQPHVKSVRVSHDGNDYAGVSYVRPNGSATRAGIVYAGLRTTSLTSPWSSAGVVVHSVTPSAGEEMETVVLRSETPLAANQQEYLRVQVTETLY